MSSLGRETISLTDARGLVLQCSFRSHAAFSIRVAVVTISFAVRYERDESTIVGVLGGFPATEAARVVAISANGSRADDRLNCKLAL